MTNRTTEIQIGLKLESSIAPAEWSKKLDPGKIDGIRGPRTIAAIQQWHLYKATHAQGLDFSSYQPEKIDWQAVIAAGITFCIFRSSVGTYTDKEFDTKIRGAIDAGMIVGLYHFVKPGSDAWLKLQVDTISKMAERVDFFDLPAARRFPVTIDIEKNLAGPDEISGTADDIRITDAMAEKMADLVEDMSGELPLIYSFTPYLSTHKISVPRCKYWGADWREPGLLTLPPGWTNYLIHQYLGDTGRCAGVTENGRPSPIDRNRFNGTQAELDRYLTTRKARWEL